MINSGANKNSSQQATTTEVTNIPLAIVGIGCLFPQANSKDNFWANIKGGVDSITDVPETHWRIADLYDPDPKTPDKTYGKRGGFLEPIEFNPLEFSIQPNILEAIDTSQLLGLIAAREALKDAGYDPAGEFARERVSVLLGVTGALEMVIPLGARLGHPYWRKALKDAGIPNDVAQEVVERIADNYVSWQENSFPGLLGNVVAGRISKQFDLGGTNSVIDAACGSSLSAVHMAAMELACGHSDMVITGGIDTFNDIFMYTCFSKTPALSPSNIIRPFDSASDGTLIGEGLGLVVLKRLADAERDKDQIYAVIRGIGTASDGKKGAIYEPNAGGQKKALVSAYQLANIEPSTISLVEAHGTGTRVGDAAEIKALREVYGESTGKPWCALGSVKSQIGHTKASAGSAGLIKMALALYNKVLPPSINVVQPQEVISSGNTPFYVNTTARPWLASQDHPRRAAVSAFGFGGSNFHCVLEEHNAERQGSDWSGAPQIVALSDSDKTGLKQQLQHIAGITSAQLRRFAAQSRAKFDHSAAQRLLFIVEEKQDLAAIVKNAEQLIDAGKTLANTPSGIWYADGVVAGKMAVLFPGQGAQYPGMLVDLACHAPEFIQELQSADKTLQLTEDLSAILYPHSIYTDADQEQAMRKIQATEVAQPAIGTVSLAAWHYLNHFGVQPQAWGGHSYGELTALCAAGCFSATDLYKLSRLRGELMAGDGSDKGTMLAVSAALDKIEQLIADEKLDVVLANRNTPSQGVLSGSRAEIERAALLCKERGLRCVALDVAAAFHSKLVAAAAAPFLQALQQVTVQPAKTTVYANKTASPYPQDSTAMRSVLAEQIASPVEFVQQIENMYAAGITTFVEIGPGARLTGMVGKILKGKEHNALALDSSSGKRSGLNDLARVLIQLAAIGFPVELTKWDEEYAQHQLTLPEPIAPRMTVAICGANYVKHKAKRPASTRKLVDASTISQAAPSATLPSTPATPAAPVTAPLPAHQANPDALRSLQESMTVLQRMQEDTAKLHNKFLEGQAAAIDTMRSLMDHQMGISSAPALSAATVVTPPQSIAAPAPVPPAVTAAVAPTTTAQSTPGADVATSLLEVVAEKTGYPQEMLELDMSLDADLGIDSIKRVEILSAIQEKLPNLPALQPDQLGSLQTLRQIVEAMGSSVASAAVATSAAPAAMAGTADVATSLLEVVAEKTGYPQEMLELDMSLDADLGIDSIKRVEILSAIQEKLPNLPALQPDQLGSLQTLRQIVEAMDGTVISEGATDVEPVAVTKKKITSDPQLHRQILKIVPISTPRAELSLSAQAPIWVVDDCSSTSQLVVTELKKRNYAAELISPTHKTVPEQLSALVVIAPQIGTDSRFLSDSFLLVQRCSSALRHNSANKPSCLMTVSRLDGMAGFDRQALINDPLSGGLAGISKTASHEWPEVQCKAVDLGNDLDESAQATAIINELFTVGPLEVTVNAQGCHTLELQQANLAPSLPRLTLTSNDVVVVSGGARGVTAEVALALAEVGNPTLLLLGRSPEPESEDSWLASAKDEAAIKKALMQHAPHPLKPRELNRACVQVVNNRELTSNINRLQQTGSQVLYRSVDIRDEQAVNIAIAQARKLGTIRGIIHGAGVLADRKIEDKSVEQFDLVYSTKIGGLQALLQATHEDNLDFIGLFSSSTGRFGRTGQLDYAVANEVLNKTAQALARQRSDCRIISFNWGPWDGGMVTPALKRLFASEGISVIDLHAGAQYLLQELANPDDNVEVVILGGSSDDGSDAEKASVTSAETEQPTAKQTLAHALLPNSVLHLSISSKTIPVLRHHVINGKAVVPMALQIEWLAQGAMHNNPGLIFSGFDNLRIRSGIIVPTKSVMEVDLRYGETIVEQNSFIVPMQICSGTDSTIHASADIILTTKLTDQRPNIEPLFIDGGELSSQAEIYSSGHLFHGPQLQGLSQIVGNNNEGIIAISQYAPQPDQWMEKPLRNSWIADPQVLDSSFQMMILWSFAQKQLGSLPSFAGHYRQYCEQFPAGNIRIQCRVTKASQHSASANIDFIDAQTHQLLARMNSYECTMTDNLRQAFINNQLA